MSTQDLTIEPGTASGWDELLAGKNAIYAVALAGGVTLHAVNIYIVTTVLPSVVRDIGGLDYYAWSTTLFVVASILGAALSARLLRGAGPRGAYGVAALIFAAGTATCALAPSMSVLLTGRFVQGLGGGLLYALAYSVIRLVFPERLWSRGIGLISAMWGIATLVGPAVGGIFAEFDAWRAAFWSLVPLIALFAALAITTLPKRGSVSGKSSALPLPQLFLLTAAVLALSAASVGQDTLWSAAGMLGALGLIGLLVAVERRTRTRLLPSQALKFSTSLGALYATIALLVMGMQPEIFVPYFLQVLHGQSPLIAGYLAALMAVGWTLGSMLGSGWTGDASKRAIGTGPLLVLIGLVALAAFLPAGSADSWALLAPVCVGLVLVGLGIGIAWPHLVTQVFKVAPADEQDLATAAVTTVQLFATSFGAAAAGVVANFSGLTNPGGVAGATSAALWLFAAFIAAPALCMLTAFRIARGSQDHVTNADPRSS